MVTEIVFTAGVALIGVQRIIEVRRSRRHEARLRAQGAREHASWQVPLMAALHGAWLVASVAEVWIYARPFVPWLAATAMLVLAIGHGLRYRAMAALGERWTIRVVTLPAASPVTTGVYRYLRHPNYLGVIMEIVAVPLVHGAFVTAAVFSALNAMLLTARIRAEEQALGDDNGYGRAVAAPRRFLPFRQSSRHR